MGEGPFRFEWGTDKDGYVVVPEVRGGFDGRRERAVIRGRGGPTDGYRPLDDSGLWVQFGEMARSHAGAVRFVEKFGLPHQGETLIEEIQYLAEKLWAVFQNLSADDRLRAGQIFSATSFYDPQPWPEMRSVFTYDGKSFARTMIPMDLAAALRQQAIDAIVEDKRYQPCRNECGAWIDAAAAARRQRAFCSAKCRVYFSRRPKPAAETEEAADA